MARVICDTSFLIHVANNRIINAAQIETEIGSLEYAVPEAVLGELERLATDARKGARAKAALEYSRNFSKVEITGYRADEAIIKHVKSHRGIVATMDRQLKRMIKDAGGSILGIAGDRIVLEE